MWVRFSPATTCALVTIEVLGRDEPGALLDAVARLALDQHGRAGDAAAASAGMPSAGGDPASGETRVSNTSGNDWSPTSRPRVSDSDGGSGASGR